jgi:uncharacterized protein with HEPN domain
MKKDDSVYLHHILMAIERIEEYSEGVSLQEFLNTGIVQDGVVRQLEIIGEAHAIFPPNSSRAIPKYPGVRSSA